MVKLYLEHFKLHVKSQIEYKSSFIMNAFSQLFVFFNFYFLIVSLFTKFGNVKGFTLYEVLLCFSIIMIGFAINETFFRGIDKFDELIVNGNLDRFLVRPQGILFQVLCSKVDFVKIFRIIQAVIILIIALVKLDITWSITKVFVLLMMIISSILIFFGLFVLMASYCFITVQGLEVRNLVTDGGKFIAQYPIGIYKKGLMFVFTFIVPYAFINYYPLLYFVGKSNNILYMLSPILVIIYLIPCLWSFKIGMKHYNSVGS